MTVEHRTRLAEQLLQTIFGLREDDGPESQAWVLTIATTAMARAVLASVGPEGDPAAVIALALEQVGAGVALIQRDFTRQRFAIHPGRRGG